MKKEMPSFFLVLVTHWRSAGQVKSYCFLAKAAFLS